MLVLSLAGLQLAGCSTLGPDLAGVAAATGPVPEAVALAPTSEGDPAEAIGTDEEAQRIAQLYEPPPPAGASEPVTIQGVRVVEEVPVEASYDVSYVDEGDPFEGFNRRIFRTSNAIDEYVIEPVARSYRQIFPLHARVVFRNFTSNLESPVTLANDLMQGEWERAHVTFTRLVINSTVGIAGFHDIAADWGYEGHREDFDQTLAVYGWPSGPYLVVPIIGPSTPRHIVGRVVDSLFHPLTWLLANEPYGVVLAERAVSGIIAREQVLDTIEATRATSADYYAAIQSFYRQNRANEINNGGLGRSGGHGDAGGNVSLDEDLELNF